MLDQFFVYDAQRFITALSENHVSRVRVKLKIPKNKINHNIVNYRLGLLSFTKPLELVP
jgi:hypothetical protein